MKLYAIRDRLIDYYMQPFVGPTDRQVLAQLAQVINQEDNKSAIAQTPQHFELWRLAEIDENTGQVQGDREFLQDCASLVRDRIRADAEIRPGNGTLDGTAGLSGKAAGNPAGHANAAQRPSAGATQAENQQGKEADQIARRAFDCDNH